MSMGFTGTQHGMTEIQRSSFIHVITELKPSDFHHGDCTGSDAEAHDLVRMYLKDCSIHIWPPIDPKARAFKKPDHMELALPYLTRDKAIAYAGDVLVATPREDYEILRSGTWATVRYFKKMHNPNYALILSPHTPFYLTLQKGLW
jgi:hypothetical protein